MKKTIVLSTLLFVGINYSFARVVEKIVARVNEIVITQSELKERKESLSVRAYQTLSGTDLDKAIKEIEGETLTAMIKEAVLLERAREMGMDESKITTHYIQNFKEQNKIGSDEELDELLKKEGMSRDDLVSEIKRSVIPQYVISQEVSKNLEVSDSEITDYYNSKESEFLQPPEITMENVFISKQDNNAREKAYKFSEELHKGTAIVDALEFFDLDSSMGQPLTYVKGDLVKKLEDKAFSMEIGEISEPIETDSGFHILRLLSANKSGRVPIDKVREDIIEKLKAEKYESALKNYLDELENQYFIKVYE